MKSEITLKDFLRNQKDNSDVPELDLSPLQKHFKDGELPNIDESPVGRIRLIRAFSRKYGPNYRAYPGVSDAITHYDKESQMINLIKKNKELLRGR